jgi:hypothetical protein
MFIGLRYITSRCWLFQAINIMLLRSKDRRFNYAGPFSTIELSVKGVS